MLQNIRHDQILKIANNEGKVEVDALAERLGVTAQTIRRDLTALCDEGLLTRVHGGAILPSSVHNIEYQLRRAHLASEKVAIGQLCAAHIPNHASLFINVGTSTEAVAQALTDHNDLLVITNNIHVAEVLAASGKHEVVLAGGRLRPSDGALLGDLTVEVIEQYKTDYAIIGTSAIDEHGSLYDYDSREVRASRAIIEHARTSYLVADGSKFTRHAPVRIASLQDIDALFTDKPIPTTIDKLCKQWRTKVVIAEA